MDSAGEEHPYVAEVLVVGEQPPGYPADAYHYILMKILMAARANNLQAIDGPYLQIRNVEGYREVAQRAAALGFDGKWVLHPGQVEASNEIFSPSDDQRASLPRSVSLRCPLPSAFIT